MPRAEPDLAILTWRARRAALVLAAAVGSLWLMPASGRAAATSDAAGRSRRTRPVTIPLAGRADFDGDGLSDVVIGKDERATVAGRREAGVVRVLHGRRQTAGKRLRALSVTKVSGPEAGSNLRQPKLIGDANGDGLTDLAVTADAPGDRTSGFVIFGRAARGDIDVATCDACLRLVGTDGRIAAAGDVNGDRLADVVTTAGGQAIVVFGRTTPGVIDVTDPSAAVLRIQGAHKAIEFSVRGVGDLDGDRRDDVGVEWEAPSIPWGEPGSPAASELTVVFGSPQAGTVSLASATTRALTVRIPSTDRTTTMFPAGDLNADGHADLALGNIGVGGDGCPAAPGEYTSCEGRAWVAYGPLAPGAIDVGVTQRRVLEFAPASRSSGEFGDDAQGVGDVNGDGRSDLAIGTARGRTGRLLFGTSGRVATRRTRTLYFDDRDRTLVGEPGVQVSAVGDVNGDRYADVLAESSIYRGKRYAFLSWLVLGGPRRETVNLRRPGRAALPLPDLPG